MSNRLLALNITYAIIDTIIAALSICAFCWGAYYFGKWWMLCFCIIPLVFFNTHSAVIDADIEAVQKGGNKDGRE